MVKTIPVSEKTWRVLSRLKLETGSKTYDDLIRSLLLRRGGYQVDALVRKLLR